MTTKTIFTQFHTFKCCCCGRFNKDQTGQLWEVGQPGTYEFICFDCEEKILEESEGIM